MDSSPTDGKGCDMAAGALPLLSGHDKRSLFKNRWLDRRRSAATLGVNGGVREHDQSASSMIETTGNSSSTRRTSTTSFKNRWLKGLLTSSIIRGATKDADEKSNPINTEDGSSHNVCLMSDSPFYALTLAAQGKLRQLEALLQRDKSKLNLVDKKGRGLLHHAARYGHHAIMEFLLGQGADIDLCDSSGNTALHEAVDADKKSSIDFLLTHGADSAIMNNRHMAPIHMAAEINKTVALECHAYIKHMLKKGDATQALLHHETVDPNLPGDRGSTALHFAAYKDHPECAQILLNNKAMPCKSNELGLSACHVSAHCCSSSTLEVLLKHAERLGYCQRNELLKKLNNEKNTPLHSAVSSGDIKTVKVCLDAGADILAQQENGLSPIHLAASQNSVEMIKLMLEMNPDKLIDGLILTDNLGQTPLHIAASLDRVSAVEFLVEQGADLECKDHDGQTPLLLAAAKCSWAVVNTLVKLGASIDVKGGNNRNILHLIIRGGGQPAKFGICMCQKSMMMLLNEPDQFGCTPLHYASKKGQLHTIQQLLNLGAQMNAKNNHNQSVLHFAARYGRYNSCRQLLATEWGVNIINEPDGNGQTALHAAAEQGHVNVVQLLLQSGAGIFKDMNGNTPLHLAAANGYTNTMTAVLKIHEHLLDSVNKKLNTCLHVAAESGHPHVITLLLDMGATIKLNYDQLHALDLGIKNGMKDVCVAIISHERWKEAMSMRSTLYGCPMVGMIKYMPEVCQMILDRCRIPSGPDSKDQDFYYTYDFRYLQVDHDLRKQLAIRGYKVMPMFALNVMVKYNRVECLSHPLCTAFLAMKWCAYGVWFHLLNLFMYTAFLGCLTGFIASFPVCKMFDNDRQGESLNISETGDPAQNDYCTNIEVSSDRKLLAVVILLFCIVNAIKEVMQMIQQRLGYLTDPGNLIEWILYITCAVFIGPFLVDQQHLYQWQCGAVAIFLAWFNLLLFMQRFDFFGIYIVMFLEILKTLVKVIIVFSLLVFAFGFSFLILLSPGISYGFSSTGMSLISTSIMMLGNIDFLDIWINPFSLNELPYPALNFFMLMLFVLFMPILLINLLIGLAVGDIEAVQKNARLKRIAMQVQLHSDLEQKLPRRLIKWVDKASTKYYVNKNGETPGMPKILRTLRNLICKSNSSPSDLDDVGRVMDSDPAMEHHTYLYRELHKHKLRMKQMSADMQKQYDLLRLIVQKMEIHTELDDVDDPGHMPEVNAGVTTIGWSSSTLRHVMLKQAMMISKWKKSEAD